MQLLRISLLVRDAFVPDHTVQTSVVYPDKTGSDPGGHQKENNENLPSDKK